MGCVLCCTCSSCCAESYQTNDIHTPFTNRTHVSVPSESNKLSFNITNSSSSPHNETDNCFTFTPLVKLKKTRNGVVALQITNLLQIMNASNKYNDWNEWHFQFCYKFICSPHMYGFHPGPAPQSHGHPPAGPPNHIPPHPLYGHVATGPHRYGSNDTQSKNASNKDKDGIHKTTNEEFANKAKEIEHKLEDPNCFPKRF
eukprot:341861_1